MKKRFFALGSLILGIMFALTIIVGCGGGGGGGASPSASYSPTPSPSISPAVGDGTISGVVVDGNSSALADATISLYKYSDASKNIPAKGTPNKSTSTDSNGAFNFEKVATGQDYWIVITKADYKTIYVHFVTTSDNKDAFMQLICPEGVGTIVTEIGKAPELTSLTTDGTKATPTWTKYVTGSATFNSYVIFRSTTPGISAAGNPVNQISSMDTTTWTDTLPGTDTGYYYRIFAKIYVKELEGYVYLGSNEKLTYFALVDSVSPQNEDVARDSTISITFKSEMKTDSVEQGFSVTSDNGNDTINGTGSWNGNTYTYTLSKNMGYDRIITVNLEGAMDTEGNSLDYSWTFSTVIPDAYVNSPTGTTVMPSLPIVLEFPVAVDQSSVTDSFQISPNLEGTKSWTGNVFTFVPTQEVLTYPGQYTASVNGVKDPDGNDYPDNSISWSFTVKQIISYDNQWGTAGTGNSQFNAPIGAAFDSDGYLYVADSTNNRIQKFDDSGIYQTQWGTAGIANGEFQIPRGVAVDSSNQIYVTDSGNNRIQVFSSTGTHAATYTDSLNSPYGICLDSSGNIYVCDTGNNRIQVMNSSGVHQSTIGSAGTGNGQFSQPTGIAVDPLGNIYVSDMNNHRIQKFNSSGTYLMQWGTEGVAATEFKFPALLSLSPDGFLYIADSNNNRICKYDTNGNIITTYGESGTGNGQFTAPLGTAVDYKGNIIVVDTSNNRIQKLERDNFISKFGSTGSADGQFNSPEGIAFAADGSIYVSDMTNNVIQKFDRSGNFVLSWGATGSGDGQFQSVTGIAVDSAGNVYAADTGNYRIQKFDSSGNFISKVGSNGSGNLQFNAPSDVALDSSGNIYVADTGNNRIQILDSSMAYVATWGSLGSGATQMNTPTSIAVDSSGRVYVADLNNHRVMRWDSSSSTTVWGSNGSDQGQFVSILGIAVDSDSNVYVLDNSSTRIQKFASDGTFIDCFGSSGSGDGEFTAPFAIGVDPVRRIMAVTDTNNDRVQIFPIVTP